MNEEKHEEKTDYGLPCAKKHEIGEVVERLERLVQKVDHQFQKIMQGFWAIEKSFKLCGGRMMGFQEDLCEALGKIETDPFDL